jgi:2-polyprenyl-3-methyl-5-hydroxy-6-metoxy-1,4-benzoquinol methylase
VSPCPLCDTQNPDLAFQKNGFRYHRCSRCQSLYVDLELADQTVHEHYSENYFESEMQPSGDVEEERQGYPSYRKSHTTLTDSFRNKLDVVRAHVDGGRLLDTGAAYGFFVKIAAPYFDAQGIDISEYAASVARTEFQANVVQGNVEAMAFPDDTFDAVVMWDIIEHLIRPARALQEIRRVLKPGGFLFVSTDDAASWLPRLLGRRWWALAPPLHLCHFSKLGLTLACERAGLGTPAFKKDPREYTACEIVKHFAVSYQSRTLGGLASLCERVGLNKLVLRVARPEQFIAAIQKPEAH